MKIKKHIWLRRLIIYVMLFTLGSAAPARTEIAVWAANVIKIPEAVVAAEFQKITDRPEKLIPMGRTIGVKLFSEGVMVVGISEIETAEGAFSPAEKAGLKKGDIITGMNGRKVDTIEELTAVVKSSSGSPITLEIKRGGKTLELSVTPVIPAGGEDYKFGAWIRDSMAGIGTMTFYDPLTGTFGALGHGVNDADTSMLVPLSVGAVMDSSVVSVKKGRAGNPGELQGAFDMTGDLGSIFANTEFGIFGNIDADRLELGKAIEIADKSEITAGSAKILSNIDGREVKNYDIEIIKVYPSAAGSSRNMMIEITDQELLNATGGIVQGMSGSPIIQNGKIIGAVTHVLVKDPTRGYGIYIGNMLDQVYENIKDLAS